jgi:hypothetical protein
MLPVSGGLAEVWAVGEVEEDRDVNDLHWTMHRTAFLQCQRPEGFWIGAVPVGAAAPAADSGTATRGPDAAAWRRRCRAQGDRPAPCPLPRLMLYLTSPTKARSVRPCQRRFDLVSQRDSNPRCRLESAKSGLTRQQ